MMRSVLALALLLLAVPCWAQSANRVEIFGGYSYATNDFTGATLYNYRTSLKRGWNASASLKINRFSQFVADFGGYYLPLSSNNGFCNFQVSTCRSSAYTLMFGPQFSFPVSKFTPFVHGLIGVALARQNGTFSSVTSNHSFVDAFGGGADYALTHHFGVRGQFDYLSTHFTNGDNQVPFHNDHIRLSAGVFVRF